MKRTITIETDDAVVRLVEDEHEDWTKVTVKEQVGAVTTHASVVLAPDQLWKLAEQILSWFDAKPVRSDERHQAASLLRGRVERVLSANEARCLDDDTDRGVVARELVKELSQCP